MDGCLEWLIGDHQLGLGPVLGEWCEGKEVGVCRNMFLVGVSTLCCLPCSLLALMTAGFCEGLHCWQVLPGMTLVLSNLSLFPEPDSFVLNMNELTSM